MIKGKIAQSMIKRKLKEKPSERQSFAGFFKKSFNFLVLMPEDEHDFNHSFNILKYLDDNRKVMWILTNDFRVSLVPIKYRHHVIEITLEDINKFKLPNKKLEEKLSSLFFNAVLDLNRKDNLFYSYISNIANAPIRVGFQKNDSDKFYNLQIMNNIIYTPEVSYKNFLNCLRMF